MTGRGVAVDRVGDVDVLEERVGLR
jgi:hypothetical protein